MSGDVTPATYKRWVEQWEATADTKQKLRAQFLIQQIGGTARTLIRDWIEAIDRISNEVSFNRDKRLSYGNRAMHHNLRTGKYTFGNYYVMKEMDSDQQCWSSSEQHEVVSHEQ